MLTKLIRIAGSFSLLCLALTLAGCGDQEWPSESPSTSPPAQAEVSQPSPAASKPLHKTSAATPSEAHQRMLDELGDLRDRVDRMPYIGEIGLHQAHENFSV